MKDTGENVRQPEISEMQPEGGLELASRGLRSAVDAGGAYVLPDSGADAVRQGPGNIVMASVATPEGPDDHPKHGQEHQNSESAEKDAPQAGAGDGSDRGGNDKPPAPPTGPEPASDSPDPEDRLWGQESPMRHRATDDHEGPWQKRREPADEDPDAEPSRGKSVEERLSEITGQDRINASERRPKEPNQEQPEATSPEQPEGGAAADNNYSFEDSLNYLGPAALEMLRDQLNEDLAGAGDDPARRGHIENALNKVNDKLAQLPPAPDLQAAAETAAFNVIANNYESTDESAPEGSDNLPNPYIDLHSELHDGTVEGTVGVIRDDEGNVTGQKELVIGEVYVYPDAQVTAADLLRGAAEKATEDPDVQRVSGIAATQDELAGWHQAFADEDDSPDVDYEIARTQHGEVDASTTFEPVGFGEAMESYRDPRNAGVHVRVELTDQVRRKLNDHAPLFPDNQSGDGDDMDDIDAED